MHFADLSVELFLHVASYLRHHDLVRLNAVNRDLNRLVEPLLYTHVELHMPDHHRRCDDDGPLLDDLRHQRPYRYLTHEEHISASTKVGGHDNMDELRSRYERAADMFFTDLNLDLLSKDNNRAHQRCRMVRSLSAPVEDTEYVPPEMAAGKMLLLTIWNTIPRFANLERLELAVHWLKPHKISPFSPPEEPLRNLRVVKLMGYVPAFFVNYIVRSSATIECLDLGLLDAPIGDALCVPQINPPPDARTRNAGIGSAEQNRWHVEGFLGDESGDDYDFERIAPRPLSWMPDILPAMPRLTHLRLCKPGQIDELLQREYLEELSFSTKPDLQSVAEWTRLLRNVQSSLQCLVLEQRPATVRKEKRFSTNIEFLETLQQSSTPRLIEALELVLEGGSFAALKQITFCGLLNENNPKTSELKNRLVSMCESKGIQHKFQLGKRCLVDPDSGEMWKDFIVARDGMGAEDLGDDSIP